MQWRINSRTEEIEDEAYVGILKESKIVTYDVRGKLLRVQVLVRALDSDSKPNNRNYRQSDQLQDLHWQIMRLGLRKTADDAMLFEPAAPLKNP